MVPAYNSYGCRREWVQVHDRLKLRGKGRSIRAGLAERFRRPPAERIYGGSNPSPGSNTFKKIFNFASLLGQLKVYSTLDHDALYPKVKHTSRMKVGIYRYASVLGKGARLALAPI